MTPAPEALTLVLVSQAEALETSPVGEGELTGTGKIAAARAADAVYGAGRRHWLDLPRVTRVVAPQRGPARTTAEALGRRLGVHVEVDVALHLDVQQGSASSAMDDAVADAAARPDHAVAIVAHPWVITHWLAASLAMPTHAWNSLEIGAATLSIATVERSEWLEPRVHADKAALTVRCVGSPPA